MRRWLWLVLAACSSEPSPATPDPTIVASVPVTRRDKLDLLFVVDDANGGPEQQIRVAPALSVLAARLHAEGSIDLHAAVVTSDLGTSGTATSPAPDLGPYCKGTGRAGKLVGPIVADVADLAEQVKLGIGCFMGQSLAAMRIALTDDNGFRRPDALLGVVFVGQDDDCTVTDARVFTDDPTLGPLHHFRCAQFGVTCASGGETPDAMATPGVKGNCVANPHSTVFDDPAPYRTFLASLQPDPSRLFVEAVVAPSGPLEVALIDMGDATPTPGYLNTCHTDAGGGPVDPAPRLASFADEVVSLCEPDLAPGLAQIGRRAAAAVGSPCLLQPVADPSVCTVREVTATGARELTGWHIDTDTARCLDFGQKLVVDEPVDPAATLVVACQL